MKGGSEASQNEKGRGERGEGGGWEKVKRTGLVRVLASLRVARTSSAPAFLPVDKLKSSDRENSTEIPPLPRTGGRSSTPLRVRRRRKRKKERCSLRKDKEEELSKRFQNTRRRCDSSVPGESRKNEREKDRDKRDLGGAEGSKGYAETLLRS